MTIYLQKFNPCLNYVMHSERHCLDCLVNDTEVKERAIANGKKKSKVPVFTV